MWGGFSHWALGDAGAAGVVGADHGVGVQVGVDVGPAVEHSPADLDELGAVAAVAHLGEPALSGAEHWGDLGRQSRVEAFGAAGRSCHVVLRVSFMP